MNRCTFLKRLHTWIKTPSVARLAWLPIFSAAVVYSRACSADSPFDKSADSRFVTAYLPFAQFKIPFNVEAFGSEPVQVQLWVSTDDGDSWQLYRSVQADVRQFDFRAAAEGVYHFKVNTVDASGASHPSLEPPLVILVDTTKPQTALRADINSQGQLVVDLRVIDQNLDLASSRLHVRTDHDSQWQEILVEPLLQQGEVFEGQVIVDIAPCREIALVFTVKDLAANEGEATFKYTMPRTAAADKEMTLASTRNSSARDSSDRSNASSSSAASIVESLPGATPWRPSPPTRDPNQSAARQVRSTTPPAASELPTRTRSLPRPTADVELPQASLGRLTSESQLSLDNAFNDSLPEELPLPQAVDVEPDKNRYVLQGELELEATADRSQPLASAVPKEPPLEMRRNQQGSQAPEISTIDRAFHCSSRAFSLDYSVQALGGSSLSDVELWGTEDGGRRWEKWGSDPDRQSPFEVQVGNDGMFGFRMVVVSANGMVSNRPREGDSADVWINVDTSRPVVRITRAVYGVGPEDGLLVVDYNCEDEHLVERPITLSFSERADGPWATIATGLANTGIYLWKADPNLPEKVYLKIECIDKAGNVGSHRLDVPIDIRGMAPRGVIQGFRPIVVPSAK